MHLLQGEEWKINEELRKTHFQGYRDWKGNENWKWRERFKLSASSSGKSYKWRVNVNIPTEKWKTTKESFKLGLDWNYKHPGQSSLRFIHECPSIWDAQAYGHWTYRAQPRSPWASVSWRRTTMYAGPNVFSLWSCLGTAAYKPNEDEGELGKTRYLKNFLEDFFPTRWYNSFSKEKKKSELKATRDFVDKVWCPKQKKMGRNHFPLGLTMGLSLHLNTQVLPAGALVLTCPFSGAVYSQVRILQLLVLCSLRWTTFPGEGLGRTVTA